MKLLQHFGFQKSSYERPTQKWVCGHSDSGKACPAGPNGRGLCQATFECQPVQTDGRWNCTRAASGGGICEEGPQPNGVCCKAIPKCQPKLSIRAKRARAVRWASSLAVGFVVLIASFGSDMKLLMPGPLNTAHSSLKSCGDCHANVAGGDFGWLHSIFAPADATKDSSACLTCHKIGTEALNPHGLAQTKLAALTKAHQKIEQKEPAPISARFANALFPVKKTLNEGVNCATCHKEHQGEKFDLTAMPDVQCQSCHTAQFASFQNGHPEFTNYPYNRRTRIIFDHSSHFGTHFPKTLKDGKSPDAQPGVCADCHMTDANKGLMVVKPYEQMCSTCHTGQIVGADRANGPKGITLLALPGLDVETLREKNADIGEWPEDSEAEIPALLKLLIGVDDKRRKMLEAVEKLDLLDLTEATDNDIANVEALVWEMKNLIYQFSMVKPTEAMKMLSPKMGGSIDAKLLTGLTANMPRDVMLGVQRDWLPNLAKEVQRHMQGKRLMPLVEPAESKEEEKTETNNSQTETTKSADAGSDDILAEKKDDSIISEGDDILAEKKDDSIISEGDDILAEKKDDSIISEGDDILAEKKDDSIISEGDDILAEKKDDSIISEGDDILAEKKDDESLEGEVDKEKVASASETEDKVEMPEPVEAEEWAEGGGWYRQDFAVLYKPTGHSDSFMKSWLNYSGSHYGNAKAKLAAPVFDMLTNKQAQGQCAKCHSIDSSNDQSRKINWIPFTVKESIGKFTKFSHEPHFGLFGDKGCLSCHVVNGEAKYRDTYKAHDPKVFASNFKPVEQQLCTTCHQKKAAGENCQLCHIYHVDDVNTPIMNTKLPSK